MSELSPLPSPLRRDIVHLLGDVAVGDGAAERGSNVMIGWPNDGASDSRTERGTTVRSTLSPKWSRTSLTT